MEGIIGIIFGALIAAFIAGVLLYLISALNLGLKVKNFGWAMIIGLFVGVLTTALVNLTDNFMTVEFSAIGAAIYHAIIMAGVLYSSSYWFKDKLQVNGFSGALIASLVMALVGYLLSLFV